MAKPPIKGLAPLLPAYLMPEKKKKRTGNVSKQSLTEATPTQLKSFAQENLNKTKIQHKPSNDTKSNTKKQNDLKNIVKPKSINNILGKEKNKEASKKTFNRDEKGRFAKSTENKTDKVGDKTTAVLAEREALQTQNKVEQSTGKIEEILDMILTYTVLNSETLKQISEKETPKPLEPGKEAKKPKYDPDQTRKKGEDAIRFDDGKKSRKNRDRKGEGFFDKIRENVKGSTGGLLVKSIAPIFARIAPVLGVALATGLIAGGMYYTVKSALSKEKNKSGNDITPDGTPFGATEAAGPVLTDPKQLERDKKIEDAIAKFEGPNKEKADFNNLDDDQKKQTLKLLGNKDEDIEDYMKRSTQKNNPNINDTSKQITTIQSRRLINPGSSYRTNNNPPPTNNRRGNMEQDITDPNISPEGKALLDTIATHESGGDYNIRQGGGHLDDLSRHPGTIGPRGISTASGKYQFIKGTWDEAAKALNLKDFSPESQDKAAWWLAQRDYKKRTGDNLSVDIKSKDPAKQMAIAQALHGTWTSMPGGYDPGLGKAGRGGNEYLQTLAKNTDKYTNLAKKEETKPETKTVVQAPTPPTKGELMTKATEETNKLKEQKDNPQPVIVQQNSQPNKTNNDQQAMIPSVRSDDPTLLQALRGDIQIA